MLKMTAAAMQHLSGQQRSADLRRIASFIKTHDPASVGVRSIEEVDVFVRRAEAYAAEVGLNSCAAILHLTSWGLLLADRPERRKALNPWIELLVDASRSEDDRLQDLYELMYDLDGGLPDRLKRQALTMPTFLPESVNGS